MIKMVATDIDGTILKYDFVNFTSEVKKCIKFLRDKGIKVVLATGRMHKAAQFLADELGIDTPIISYQGGFIKDKAGKVYYRKDLDSSVAKEIIKWARENKVHINLYMNDVLYVENDNEIVKRYTNERLINYEVCNFDNLEIKGVNKILAIKFDDADTVTEWLNYLKNKYPNLYIVKSTPYFCEISDKEATKSRAVEFLCREWGIKKEEVLAIGDQNNDIELLKSGGIKVAMGNATEELKKYADYITDTVDNNGFVKAMEKYCII